MDPDMQQYMAPSSGTMHDTDIYNSNSNHQHENIKNNKHILAKIDH